MPDGASLSGAMATAGLTVRRRECTYRAELDTESLVWTRGRDFPVNRLAERLRCPRCGSRYVRVLFDAPNDKRQAH
jgi:hypothetical protein